MKKKIRRREVIKAKRNPKVVRAGLRKGSHLGLAQSVRKAILLLGKALGIKKPRN